MRCAAADERSARCRPDVVDLHDQRDHAVDQQRDADGHHHQDHRAGEEGLVGDLVEGDDHDLGRQDEVGADRALDHLVLRGLRGHRVVVGGRSPVRCTARPVAAVGAVGAPAASAQGAPDLVRALVAEVGRAEHEDRGDRPRQELAEQQRRREDHQQLVAQGARGDAPDDRHLAVGGDAVDVLRGDGRVVDHHAGGLDARATRGRADVVDRRRGQPGQRGDVVEEPEETCAHRARSGVGAGGRDAGRGDGVTSSG